MADYTERDIDELYRILDLCDRIEKITNRIGNALQEFLSDAVYGDAVKMNLLQIGEVTNRLSDACKEKCPEAGWCKISGLRNIIVHSYEKVDDTLIWNIAVRDVPELKARITERLREWGEDEDM